MNNNKKAVAMLRSATLQQDKQYGAILRQYEAVEKYAQSKNIKIKAVHDNTQEYIGKIKTANQILKEVYGYCLDNKDVKYVIVPNASRISRNFDIFKLWVETFESIGVKIKVAQ